MKDILDEGGDFYNLHKLVFHDLDPEMHLGAGLTWYPQDPPRKELFGLPSRVHRKLMTAVS
jgi:hypothetical protein